jgi:hypothetical protein
MCEQMELFSALFSLGTGWLPVSTPVCLERIYLEWKYSLKVKQADMLILLISGEKRAKN